MRGCALSDGRRRAQVSADGAVMASRRGARRPGAAGALGRLARAGLSPHAGMMSLGLHAPLQDLGPGATPGPVARGPHNASQALGAPNATLAHAAPT